MEKHDLQVFVGAGGVLLGIVARDKTRNNEGGGGGRQWGGSGMVCDNKSTDGCHRSQRVVRPEKELGK
jgi:hypothetical protein